MFFSVSVTYVTTLGKILTRSWNKRCYIQEESNVNAHLKFHCSRTISLVSASNDVRSSTYRLDADDSKHPTLRSRSSKTRPSIAKQSEICGWWSLRINIWRYQDNPRELMNSQAPSSWPDSHILRKWPIWHPNAPLVINIWIIPHKKINQRHHPPTLPLSPQKKMMT